MPASSLHHGGRMLVFQQVSSCRYETMELTSPMLFHPQSHMKNKKTKASTLDHPSTSDQAFLISPILFTTGLASMNTLNSTTPNPSTPPSIGSNSTILSS